MLSRETKKWIKKIICATVDGERKDAIVVAENLLEQGIVFDKPFDSLVKTFVKKKSHKSFVEVLLYALGANIFENYNESVRAIYYFQTKRNWIYFRDMIMLLSAYSKEDVSKKYQPMIEEAQAVMSSTDVIWFRDEWLDAVPRNVGNPRCVDTKIKKLLNLFYRLKKS